jgi:hypothetical protein
MVILLLILVLASNAVTSRRERCLYISSIVSLVVSIIISNYLDVTALSRCIRVYGDFLVVESFPQLLNLFVIGLCFFVIIFFILALFIIIKNLFLYLIYNYLLHIYRSIKGRLNSFLKD